MKGYLVNSLNEFMPFIEVMKRDMELLETVVDGFVVGCLDVDGNVDVAACKALLGVVNGDNAPMKQGR